MRKNFITENVLSYLDELELDLRLRDKEYIKFRKLAITATPLLKVNWGLWG